LKQVVAKRDSLGIPAQAIQHRGQQSPDEAGDTQQPKFADSIKPLAY